MKILSIDWDFFFPDASVYDWGHREEPLFFEVIWSIRAGARSLISQERAVDKFKIDEWLYQNFWSFVCVKKPGQLIITESHKDIYQFLEMSLDKSTVFNLDAHCDMYDTEKEIHCGNWASNAVEKKYITRFSQNYPYWRQSDVEEHKIASRFKAEIGIGVPSLGGHRFDLIFICRSSAWTPTWADDKWIEFISYFKKWPDVWRNKRFAPYCFHVRKPNLIEAEELSVKFDQQMDEWRKKNGK